MQGRRSRPPCHPSLQLPRPLPPHPGLGELGISAYIDPALEGLLPGVSPGTVGRDRLELPLEALERCETRSGFCRYIGIVLHDVPVRWHKLRHNQRGTNINESDWRAQWASRI